MGLQERIVYDSQDLIQIIEEKLDQLKRFQFDSNCRSLLGDAFICRLSEWDKNIRLRKEDPFTIVVCGEFKRGKSSLINALLGEDIAVVNATTETVALNKISYGIHSNEALLSGGRRLRLSDEELHRERLEELIRQAGEPIHQLELKRPIELLKGVTIIDTPGLGDALKDYSELVEQALRQADAVIYVFSVNYPLSQREQIFLKAEILPQKYTDLFLVGNYTDMLGNEENYKRMKQQLAQKIQGLLPGQDSWMLSALDERCRQQNEERPNSGMEELLSRNFDCFRERISQLVEEKQEMVLPDRMQRMLKGMIIDLSENLSAMERGLAMDSQGIQAAQEQMNEQCGQQAEDQKEAFVRIEEKVKTMQAETYEWIGNLLDQMQKEVDDLTNVPVADLMKYYSFYCIDTLQEAMNRCMKYHMLQLYDELEEISFQLTKGLSKHMENNDYSFRFALDNRTWTKGDNVSYIISKVGIGAVSLLADGITGFMRQKEIAAKTQDILQKIRQQYTGLRASSLIAVENAYLKMADGAKKQLDEYYGEKIRIVREQMEQSFLVSRQAEAEKVKIKEVISQIRTVLAGMEGETWLAF